MRLLATLALIWLLAFATEATALAHGGTYRGPGDPNRGPADSVPPGAQSPSGGTSGPGSNPSGGGATAAGGGRLTTQGVQAPSGTNPALSNQLTQPEDPSEWRVWWGFNQDPFLALKEAVWARGPAEQKAGWFSERLQRSTGPGYWRPTARQVDEDVLPALKKALENETDNDIVTGCLIALARIGASRPDLADALAAAIRPFLQDSVQEIAETAAVSLGILSSADAALSLDHLVLDDDRGRRLVCGGPVHYRTRSFAAFGLGLLGAQTDHEGLRSHVLDTLARVLSDPSLRRDVQVAAVIAFGMTPLERLTAPAVDGVRAPHVSRMGQLEFLLELFEREDLPGIVRGHVPTSLARLLGGLPPEEETHYREWITHRLMSRLEKPGSVPNEVLEGIVIALGRIGDNDADPLDARIRDVLAKVPDTIADARCRNQSLMALGRVGARFGPGADALAGTHEVLDHLAGVLKSGRSTLRPWAGLALGVLAHDLAAAGHAVPTKLGKHLADAFEEEGNPTRASAYAVALGLSDHAEAAPLLLAGLERFREEFPRGNIAIALGLLGAGDARAPIQALAEASRYRPELLRCSATALGLLGDEELVPRLSELLVSTESLAAQASLARALGHVGDGRTIEPLVEMLEDEDLTDRARGFAAVALGLIADPALLPWNSRLSVDLNYRAASETLNDSSGTGILNIL